MFLLITVHPRSLGVPEEIESQTAEADGTIHRFEEVVRRC